MQSFPFISELSIRASAGQTGNQQGIAEYAAFGSFQTGRIYAGQAGIIPLQVGSPDLKWETTDKFMLAVDLGLMENRILLTSEVYLHQTRDLLINRTAPYESGLGQNNVAELGDIQNLGLELDLNTINMVGKFKWNTNFNISLTETPFSNCLPGINVLGAPEITVPAVLPRPLFRC